MVFGKKKDKDKEHDKNHVCEPNIFHIVAVREEMGGTTWLLSAKEFDILFCGEVVWSVSGTVWGIKQISTSECMKIYRGN
jgi:hypothetical protein